MERYDLKTSKSVYEAFKLIYLNEKEIAPKEIAEILGKSIGSVSEQLRPLREQGLVNTKDIGRDRFYSINLQGLKKFLGKTNFETGLILSAKNFKDLANRAKKFGRGQLNIIDEMTAKRLMVKSADMAHYIAHLEKLAGKKK